MIKQVIKRDGRIEDFAPYKIREAVFRCLICNNRDLKSIDTDYIIKQVEQIDKTTVSVEEIQDAVVKALSKLNTSIANSYQQYRIKRTKNRDAIVNGKYYDTIVELATGVPNEISHENGNKDATQFNVMRDLIAGETCKKIYKETIMSPYLLKLHNEGAIHVHDLDYRLMKGVSNCSLLNLEDILQKGTVLNGKKINKPHSLRTATTIATQALTQCTSMQYGGVSVTTAHLAPFVRISKNYYKTYLSSFPYISKEDKERMINEMLNKEIKDSIQTFLYQLNSMIGTNGQAPFCTVFCYIHENEEYIEENVALIKELFKQRIKGMEGPNGNNINPSFPKLIYVLDEDNIEAGTKYYDVTKLAAECTCKRMVPDYISAKVMKKYKEGNVFPSINKSVA